MHIPLLLSCKGPFYYIKLSFLALNSIYGIFNIFIRYLSNYISNSCFPHIVNLACKAMLNNISGLDLEDDIIKKLQGVINGVSF
jgi:hypothetical protein